MKIDSIIDSAIFEIVKALVSFYLKLCYKHVIIEWSIFAVFTVMFLLMTPAIYSLLATPLEIKQAEAIIRFMILDACFITVAAVAIPYVIEYKETGKVSII